MARAERPPDPPLLFDLPLHEPAEPDPLELQPAPASVPPRQGRLDLDEAAWEENRASAERAPAPGLATSAELEPAGLFVRLRAALLDAGMHGLALVLAALVAFAAGVPPTAATLPALGLFLLPFSFLYCVIPLFFFGRTAGMRWTGLVSRSHEGLSLALGQAVRRWLLGLLFAALGGLPLLLIFDRRSLADRWSGSRTLRRLSG